MLIRNLTGHSGAIQEHYYYLLLFSQRHDTNSAMELDEITSEIENIVGQIIRKYRPMKIILFGSAGRGEYDKVNNLR